MKLKTALIGGGAVLFALLVLNQMKIGTPDQPQTDLGELSSLLSALRDSNQLILSDLRSSLFNESGTQKEERLALEEIKGFLYSPDSDQMLPPLGMETAIFASGSRKREALEILREAIYSRNHRASHRAGTSVKYFHEFADELEPEILALMRTSTDGQLLGYIGSIGFNLKQEPDSLPDVIEAFKSNPAAADGMRMWFGAYFRFNKSDQSAGLKLLSPLLDSPDKQQRLTAAVTIASTSGKDDPRLTSALLPGLKINQNADATSTAREEDSVTHQNIRQAIGTAARPAGEMVAEFARETPMLRHQAYETLAKIAPDLRSEIPELDEKLKKMETSAELEKKMQSGKGTVSDLLLGLKNTEGREKAVATLATLSDHAAEILPRLREILNAGDAEKGDTAANYLDAVGRSIRKLDPSAPAYFSSYNLSHPLMEASEVLEKSEAKASKTLADTLNARESSPRPYTLEEVISIVEKIKAVDPTLAESFVKKLDSKMLTEMQTLNAQLKERGYGAK